MKATNVLSTTLTAVLALSFLAGCDARIRNAKGIPLNPLGPNALKPTTQDPKALAKAANIANSQEVSNAKTNSDSDAALAQSLQLTGFKVTESGIVISADLKETKAVEGNDKDMITTKLEINAIVNTDSGQASSVSEVGEKDQKQIRSDLIVATLEAQDGVTIALARKIQGAGEKEASIKAKATIKFNQTNVVLDQKDAGDKAVSVAGLRRVLSIEGSDTALVQIATDKLNQDGKLLTVTAPIKAGQKDCSTAFDISLEGIRQVAKICGTDEQSLVTEISVEDGATQRSEYSINEAHPVKNTVKDASTLAPGTAPAADQNSQTDDAQKKLEEQMKAAEEAGQQPENIDSKQQ